MRLYRQILSLVLVVAFLNVIIEKALHELFEHHNEIHACIDAKSTHFHNHEFDHLDFICEFNISSTLLSVFSLYRNATIPCVEKKVTIINLWLVAENYLNSIQLRGPPYLNS